MEEWWCRTELLVGDEAMARLRAARLLIIGIGGVGGAAVEMLVRAGIGSVTLVDSDKVQCSNINRQLIATQTTVGRLKTDVWSERLLSINPDLHVETRSLFIEPDNVEALLTEQPYDYVIDAIDTITPKVALLETCVRRGLPVIASMGSGGKTDPSLIQTADISKTAYCPLAKVVRTRLAKIGIRHGITCIFSTEIPDRNAVIPTEGEPNKKTTTGTLSYMPNLFGCHIAGYVIRQLIENPRK